MSSIDDLLTDIGDAMAIKEDTKSIAFDGREKMKPRPPPQEKSPKKSFSRSKYHGGAGSSTRSHDDESHDYEGSSNIGVSRDRADSDGSLDGENSFDRLMTLLSTGEKEVADDVPTNIFSKQWTEPRNANRFHASPNSSSSSSTSRYGQSSESKNVAMTTTISSSIGDGFDDDDDVGGGHAATQRADEKKSPLRGLPRENKTVATVISALSVSHSNSHNVSIATSGHSSNDSLMSTNMVIHSKKNSTDDGDDDDDWDNPPNSTTVHNKTNRLRIGSMGSEETSPGGGLRRSPTTKHLSTVGSTDDADDSSFYSFPTGVGGGGSNENIKTNGKEFYDNANSSRMHFIAGEKGGGSFGSNMGGNNGKSTSDGISSTPTPMYYNRGSYYYNSTAPSSSSSSSSSSPGPSLLFGPSSSNVTSVSNHNNTTPTLVAISHGNHSHSGLSGHINPSSSMDSSGTHSGSGIGISRGGSSPGLPRYALTNNHPSLP